MTSFPDSSINCCWNIVTLNIEPFLNFNCNDKLISIATCRRNIFLLHGPHSTITALDGALTFLLQLVLLHIWNIFISVCRIFRQHTRLRPLGFCTSKRSSFVISVNCCVDKTSPLNFLNRRLAREPVKNFINKFLKTFFPYSWCYWHSFIDQNTIPDTLCAGLWLPWFSKSH